MRGPPSGRLSLGASFRSRVGSLLETSPTPAPPTPASTTGDKEVAAPASGRSFRDPRGTSYGRLSLNASFRSTVGSILESSSSQPAPPTPASVAGDKEPLVSASRKPSRLSFMSAFGKMPTLEAMLFDTTSKTSSRHTSGGRHSTDTQHRPRGHSQHSDTGAYGRRTPSSVHKALSESGAMVSRGVEPLSIPVP